MTSSFSSSGLLHTQNTVTRSPNTKCSNKPWIHSSINPETSLMNGVTETNCLAIFDQSNRTSFCTYPNYTSTVLDRISGFPAYGCPSLSVSLDRTSSASPPGTFCSLDELTDPSAGFLLDSEIMRMNQMGLRTSKQHCNSTDARWYTDVLANLEIWTNKSPKNPIPTELYTQIWTIWIGRTPPTNRVHMQRGLCVNHRSILVHCSVALSKFFTCMVLDFLSCKYVQNWLSYYYSNILLFTSLIYYYLLFFEQNNHYSAIQILKFKRSVLGK